MPNSKIENGALNALENIIDAHNTMSHQFNSLDKEMSWDGSILIFKDNEGSPVDLIDLKIYSYHPDS